MKALALGYHDVLDGASAEEAGLRKHPGRYALSVESFRRHLESIPLPSPVAGIAVIEELHRWSGTIPLLLTFDDGASCAYTTIAPELEKRGWRGCFFVVSSWIGRPGFMGAREIRELRRRGHMIGSHSRSHPESMSSLSRNELQDEWKESCADLSGLLGETVRVASVPNGYYSKAVGEAAASAGIEILFNSEPTRTIKLLDGCAIVGRYSIKAGDSPRLTGSLIESRACRSRQALLWQARKFAKFIGGPAYLNLRSMYLSRAARSDSASTTSHS